MKKQPTRSDSGSFTVKKSSFYYCLRFRQNGRTAVEMVQFIDDILRSEYPERAIIKYLGFTAEVTRHSPGKGADYWVEIDLDRRILETNSELIRRVVGSGTNSSADEADASLGRRIYKILDEYDFTVRLFQS